jgi:hypothetical protein
MKTKRAAVAAIFLVVLATFTVEAQTSTSPSYGVRFVNNMVLELGTTYQYRSSSSTVHMPSFFGDGTGSGPSITPQIWGDFERTIGINFPGSIDAQFVGTQIPVAEYVNTQHKVFEFQQNFVVGLPYIQARVQWANNGRLSPRDPFVQPSILRLGAQLIDGDPNVITSITSRYLEHSLAQDALVRGRLDIQLELNMKNMLFYKLQSQPIPMNGSGSLSLDINVYPYYIVRSFDASHRIGSLQGFGVDDFLAQEIEAVDIPAPVRGVLQDGLPVLARIIDRSIFVPAGLPLYKGYGLRTEGRLYIGPALVLNASVDYSQISNAARGVDPIASTTFSCGIKVGLNGHKHKTTTRQSQITRQPQTTGPTQTTHFPNKPDTVTVVIRDTVVIRETVLVPQYDHALSSSGSDNWVIRLGVFKTGVDLTKVGITHHSLLGQTIDVNGKPHFAVYIDRNFPTQNDAQQFANQHLVGMMYSIIQGK